MNELCKLIAAVQDGDTLVLEAGKIYDVRQDDSFEMTGYFCSNTTNQAENPNGLRRTAIWLKEKKNIVIDGNGATLLVHGKMTPMLFDHCENITVKNLEIDYACPTMTEFTVLENKDGVVTIRINKECLFRVEGNQLYWHGETGLDGNYYWEDRANDAFTQGGVRLAMVQNPASMTHRFFDAKYFTFTNIEQLDECTLRLTLADPGADLPAGSIVQTRNVVRDQVGSMFERCKNLVFENLRVKFMHGLGMVSQFCENITYKNCDYTPAEGRTIVSTADFFHFSGCRGQLTLEGCQVYGAQDDPINVHGTHLQVVEADAEAKTLIVRFCHAQSWGFQAFEKGDELEFIQWDTLVPYGNTTVTAWEKLNGSDIRLSVTSVPEGITLGKDVVENASWTADVHVCNCYFGPTSGRGILCTTRGEVIIENNRFENLRGAALVIEDDCNFWFESGYTRHIIFRNNEVSGCNYGKTQALAPAIQYTPKVMDENSTSFVHGKLTLTGNKFSKPVCEKHALWFEYLREIEITGNTFDAPYEIHTKVCGNIIDEGNTVL